MPPPALSVFCKLNVREFINAMCRVPSPGESCGKAQMGSIFYVGVFLNKLRDAGNETEMVHMVSGLQEAENKTRGAKLLAAPCGSSPPSLVCTDIQSSPSPSKAFSLKDRPAPSLTCCCLWMWHRGNSWCFQDSLKFSCYNDRLKNAPCMSYPLRVPLGYFSFDTDETDKPILLR